MTYQLYHGITMVQVDAGDSIFYIDPAFLFFRDGKEIPISEAINGLKAADVCENFTLGGYTLTMIWIDGAVSFDNFQTLGSIAYHLWFLGAADNATPPPDILPLYAEWYRGYFEYPYGDYNMEIAAKAALEAARTHQEPTEPAEAAPAAQVTDDATPAPDAATAPAGPTPWAVMAMPEYVNIWSDILTIENIVQREHMMNLLLHDRTTNKCILWATDAYAENGDRFNRDASITVSTLHEHPGLIKTRSQKSSKDQTARKKKNAEVFTPYWVCNQMNNHCDNEWFGREGVFNSDMDTCELVTPTAGRIQFPDGKTWQDYILSTRLEITCGEAPFLVSRYNAANGKVIPIQYRIGMLDRKLRVVNENCGTVDAWTDWAIKAVQSVYGYEYQGDNLLIARVNILMTFLEYYADRWHSTPPTEVVDKVILTLGWNLVQMNGLTYRIPVAPCDYAFKDEQSLPFVKIYDWQLEHPVEFRSLARGDQCAETKKKPIRKRSKTNEAAKRELSAAS